jgi:hypothetical protein
VSASIGQQVQRTLRANIGYSLEKFRLAFDHEVEILFGSRCLIRWYESFVLLLDPSIVEEHYVLVHMVLQILVAWVLEQNFVVAVSYYLDRSLSQEHLNFNRCNLLAFFKVEHHFLSSVESERLRPSNFDLVLKHLHLLFVQTGLSFSLFDDQLELCFALPKLSKIAVEV